MEDNITLLIPAFNEQKTIKKIIDHCYCYSQNVIIIDDGSTDNTLVILKNTSAVIFSNPKNYGKGTALFKGFQIAIEKNYHGVITLDADGQHNPDDLPKFFEHIKKFPEAFIIGARKIATHQTPKIRLLANKMADFFMSIAARKRLCDTQSGFRYYPASFLKQVISNSCRPHRFAFEAEILIAAVKNGLPVHYVDIQSCYPAGARASHYQLGKDTWEITKTITRLIFK